MRTSGGADRHELDTISTEVIITYGFSCSSGLIMAQNCVPIKDETNCAESATSRVIDRRQAQ